MLASVKLTNVKCLKGLTLTLDPNINIIVGHSDTGKTSILRGLLWALFNASTGEKLLNNQGAKECEVVLGVDGNQVTRKWSKSLNMYGLNDQSFVSFRTEVPTTIASLLNMDAVNVQRRRDVPFMVYWKSSDSAEQFSQMMDISEINESISTCNKMVSDSRQNSTDLKRKLDCVVADLLGYTEVEEAYRILEALIKDLTAIESTEQEIAKLAGLLDRYMVEFEASRRFAEAPEAAKGLAELESELAGINALSGTIKSYNDLVFQEAEYLVSVLRYSDAPEALTGLIALSDKAEELKALTSDANSLQTLLSNYYAMKGDVEEYAGAPEAMEGLLVFIEELKQITELCAEVSKLNGLLDTLDDEESSLASSLDIMNRYNDLWKQEMPNECPLCGLSRKECTDETISIS